MPPEEASHSRETEATPATAVGAHRPLAPLTLRPVNERICQVLSAQGRHVGNLKLIGKTWKFKAIGYDAGGGVLPGGGPLTSRHDTCFDVPDEATLTARLVGS